MGRKEAIRNLSLKEEQRKLNTRYYSFCKFTRDFDEAPSAYKNISKVMANQQDLVKIKVELSPLAVVKG